MTHHRYPTLLVAALASAFFGAALAQTQSDDTSRMPAKKGTAQEAQTQPSADPTDKMKGQDQTPMQDQGASDQKKAQKKSAAPSDTGSMPSDQKAGKDKTASDQNQKMAAKAEHKAKPSEPQAMKSDQKTKTGKSASDQPAQTAQASDKSMKQGTKSKRPAEEAASPDEKAYREALRDCVKQSNEGLRDSCIDSAIEKFHRNA